MASMWADRLHEIPSLCERICRNWKLSSISDFFLPPVKLPSAESYWNYEFVKTLALFYEKWKEKVVTARACIQAHMRYMNKTEEKPTAKDLWNTKEMARERKRIRERMLEDKIKGQTIGKEREMIEKRMKATKATENGGAAERVPGQSNEHSAELRDQEPDQQNDSDLLYIKHSRHTSTDQGERKRGRGVNKSSNRNDSNPRPSNHRPQEAVSSYERPTHTNKDRDELEAVPINPQGASFDDLQALYAEIDGIYEAEEDYHEARTLQLLARLQRRMNNHEKHLHIVESRVAKGRNGETAPARNESSSHSRRRTTKSGQGWPRRAASQIHQSHEAVDETFGKDQPDIEDRISFYNFGYTPEYDGPRLKRKSCSYCLSTSTWRRSTQSVTSYEIGGLVRIKTMIPHS